MILSYPFHGEPCIYLANVDSCIFDSIIMILAISKKNKIHNLCTMLPLPVTRMAENGRGQLSGASSAPAHQLAQSLHVNGST